MTTTGTEAAGDDAGRQPEKRKRNKEVVFKHCASFTDCIREINNTQVDNAEDLDFVVSIYHLIEYSY